MLSNLIYLESGNFGSERLKMIQQNLKLVGLSSTVGVFDEPNYPSHYYGFQNYLFPVESWRLEWPAVTVGRGGWTLPCCLYSYRLLKHAIPN